MTETLISLVSILIGIIGANLVEYIFKEYSFGIIGNTIAGVFGSIFFIKSFGRLGFNPASIMQDGSVNIVLLIINLAASLCGSIIAVILAKQLQKMMNMNGKMKN